jgi:FtsP/CotA-like multicopper oxidase with cupredoxin domain
MVHPVRRGGIRTPLHRRLLRRGTTVTDDERNAKSEFDTNANEEPSMSAGTPERAERQLLTRRNFFRLTGSAAAGAVVWKLAPHASKPTIQPIASARPIVVRKIAGSDGWVSMPAAASPIPPFFPDPSSPANATTYVFGFRDMSTVADSQIVATARNHAQISAPLMWFDEGDDVRITLHNVGLANRPDLFDSHTLHWHGFPNAYPYFDGVPDSSLSVPVGSHLTYRYLVDDPGTYMYHCHVEDVEHVNMGMNGMLFVRPKMGHNYVYNAASTRFDRQFGIHLSEVDVHAHYNDSQVQDTDWTDYNPTFNLMNGRAYPDTLAPNTDPLHPTGSDDPRLRYQPLSSLIQANSGETILIRLSNLGYTEHSLEVPGLGLKLIGQDGKFLGAGRGNFTDNVTIDPSVASRADVTRKTYRVDVGPGESRELLFVAPTVTQKTVFPFYDRNDNFAGNDGQVGSMRTEVHVYPPNTLPVQAQPHQSFRV